MKIALCILTRNELPSLKIIFPRIAKPGPAAGYDVIYAIDGNSSDGTADYFHRYNIPVLQQTQTGRAGAMLEAFSKIEADAYIFFSPDGNEAVEDLPRFRPFLEERADLVIASRMMAGGRNEEDIYFFKWRKWGNLFFTFFTNLFFRRVGPYITDTSNGLRAITRTAGQESKLDACDYTAEYQMTIRALKHRLKIEQFPTIEGQRVAGKSSVSSIPAGLRFLNCFIQELFFQ